MKNKLFTLLLSGIGLFLASCGARGTDYRSLAEYGAVEVHTTDRDGCLTVRFPEGMDRGLEIEAFRR